MMEKYDEVLAHLSEKIEQECGFKDATFLIIFILLMMNTSTWTFDKTYLAKLYQAIDIIEKDEELKTLVKGQEKVNED